MRIVFLGTPSFAVPALHSLSEHSHKIVAVFTQPDRPSGRGQKLQPSPVKVLAQKMKIPVYQPERIHNEENRGAIEEFRPDFIVVVAYGQILPRWLLESARFGAVNIHASLLPRYRGAAPIVRAILNGETVTGVTTMMMVEKLDAGPVLMQKKVTIPLEKTAGELAEELSGAGAELLIKTLDGLSKKTLQPVEQNEEQVSWAPRISKEMAEISWQKPALEIHNQIRALNPWPVAYAVFRNGRMQILRSLPELSPINSDALPGTFLGLSDKGIRVQCGEGTILELLEVKMAGKSRISGRAFAAGSRLSTGDQIF